MARFEPSPYRDWTPEKLQKEIAKLREKRRPISFESQRIAAELKGIDAAIQSMQFMLVCNSGLRDSLYGWRAE